MKRQTAACKKTYLRDQPLITPAWRTCSRSNKFVHIRCFLNKLQNFALMSRLNKHLNAVTACTAQFRLLCILAPLRLISALKINGSYLKAIPL